MKLFLKNSRAILTFFAVVAALTMSAGMARAQGGGAGAGAPGAGGPGGGGAGRGPGPLVVHPLHDGVYWTSGGTGVSNSGIIVGTDGVVLFDPKGTIDAAKDIITEVAKITPLPITTVIVSHAHPDHTRGLPAYPNVNIIAQRETARQIEMETFYYTWQAQSAGGDTPLDKGYLATQVVDKRADVKINGVEFVLLHWAPSHTAGDLMAYLPATKIAFIGDMGIGGRFENGGSVQGSIQAMQGLLALDCDTFVSGHAPVRTHADLQKAYDDGVAKYNKIVALWESGKSLEDAEQAMGEKVIPRPAPVIAGLAIYRPGRNMNLTEEVYEELGRR
jgi:glyoxylase-like metal-dependent hydrolase (beta-lactamase superfamily II)